MNQPNLFSYTKSELVQDAFICWLLSWAAPEFKVYDKALHDCSYKFIQSLFDKHGVCFPSKIDTVEVRQQDNCSDVLCIINNIYPILIVDKVGSKNHSAQLVRYLDEVKDGEFEERNIIPVCFQMEDQPSYVEVLESGYQPYLRADFFSILSEYHGTNAILLDYRIHLKSITDRIESFKHTDISEWDSHAWIGFYIELHKHLGHGVWGHEAGPKGGFVGFCWHFQGDERCEQFIQLEEDKFCFKIWVKNKKDRTALRSKWHKIISDKAKEESIGLNLIKPNRFGSGEFMTVCIFDGEYRESENGIIDMYKTITRLIKAENLLKSVHEAELKK